MRITANGFSFELAEKDVIQSLLNPSFTFTVEITNTIERPIGFSAKDASIKNTQRLKLKLNGVIRTVVNLNENSFNLFFTALTDEMFLLNFRIMNVNFAKKSYESLTPFFGEVKL